MGTQQGCTRGPFNLVALQDFLRDQQVCVNPSSIVDKGGCMRPVDADSDERSEQQVEIYTYILTSVSAFVATSNSAVSVELLADEPNTRTSSRTCEFQALTYRHVARTARWKRSFLNLCKSCS